MIAVDQPYPAHSSASGGRDRLLSSSSSISISGEPWLMVASLSHMFLLIVIWFFNLSSETVCD